MKDQFVPYELAVKLKELGFDEPCFGAWLRNPSILNFGNYPSQEIANIESGILAPLWQQAFDWLFQDFSVSLCISNSLSYKDKVKILDNEIRNIQNNKSQK